MPETAEEAWKGCLEIIKDNVSGQSFQTWFGPLKATHLEDDGVAVKLTIQLPSRFYYEWLEEHYFALLRKTVSKVLGSRGRLYYDIVIEKDDIRAGTTGSSMQLPARPANEPIGPETEPAIRPERPSDPPAWEGLSGVEAQYGPRIPLAETEFSRDMGHPFVIPGVRKAPVECHLNPNYTFERFIEGDCNRLARSAALAIAQNPGKTQFNPFLIYGGVGLGKTHLMQAIGNYVRANHKADTILYVSSEKFTTEFVQAIQHNRVAEFSLFYRNIDLLVIDDAQFFGGKEKTQEEFFHIFNALHQSGKQIVLSADRPPRDIEGIEERLLSRFQWGLSADMQPPDLETRIAILQRKAEDDGIAIDNEIVEFVAHNIKSNIRELEGALIRLLAFSTLNKREIDLSLAKDVLRDLIKDTQVTLSIEEIQTVVCEYLGLPVDLVRAKTRKREVVQARQIAMYFSKELTQHSLKTIGLHFGGRDHSTVIHANQTVLNQVETDPTYRQIIDEIRHKLELRSR
ncbi:MAG: chromosomal replication initiator protein DnaA [Bacteroidetes bacterium]|nr:chromosomal replication initiator protein DnaA [Bacteroidota bacterium]